MLQVTAIGHLGQDAEVRSYGGQNVINFSVPHTKKFEKDGQPVSETIWIRCAYWRERTTVAQFLKKGTLVCVIGEPALRTYKNADGIICAQLQLKVNTLELLGGKKDDNHQAPVAEPATNTFPGTTAMAADASMQPQTESDDLPF
jgi:single-strand DNA-binding protein